MVFGAAVKTFDERITTPVPLVLRASPQEGLADTDENDDESDDSFETDGHEFGLGGRELRRVWVVVKVGRQLL